MRRGACFIGTSGWSYPHWAKGRFYPKGLPQREWLAFFAAHFSTVEVNATFYRPPRPDLLERWRDATPDGFVFTLKLWRRITHEKRLADCRPALADFFATARALQGKHGVILVQLPPSMRRDDDRLDGFLADLRAAAEDPPWRLALEFRHPEWLCDTTYRVLDRHGAALCLADMPKCPATEPNNAQFIYIRRHGPAGRYCGCYTKDHLAAEAARVRAWLAHGRDVFIYFNNDLDGHAVDNARTLAAQVRP